MPIGSIVNGWLTGLKALHLLASAVEHARTWNVYLFKLMPPATSLPNQPSLPLPLKSSVCQMSMAWKCDRLWSG